MRISDGSSDVCSSDLQAGDAEIPGPGLRLRQLPGHRLPRAAPAGAGSPQAPVRHPAIGAGAGAGPRAAGRGPVLRHRDRGIPRPDRIGGHVVDGPPDEPARGRSEEHTSELQSLMRISYAVFCLKKKKKYNIKTRK